MGLISDIRHGESHFRRFHNTTAFEWSGILDPQLEFLKTPNPQYFKAAFRYGLNPEPAALFDASMVQIGRYIGGGGYNNDHSCGNFITEQFRNCCSMLN